MKHGGEMGGAESGPGEPALRSIDGGRKTRAPAPELTVVLPALNEAEIIDAVLDRIAERLAPLGTYEIIVVDDGSTDGMLAKLVARGERDAAIRCVSFARNFGHQAALRAGIAHAHGACVIMMDADLQHPPELLPKMVEAWRAGAEIVSAIRVDTERVSFLKRTTSAGFYRLMSFLGDFEVKPGSADFRLIDRKVVEVLDRFEETDLFFRGILPYVGFKRVEIPFTPAARLGGHTKYTLHRMMRLALTGIVSTSVRPLRLASILAAITALFTVLYAAYAVIIYFLGGEHISGWTSIILLVASLGAMQLLVLGIIGEYLGQTLREIRRRPSYIVRYTNVPERDETAGLPRNQSRKHF